MNHATRFTYDIYLVGVGGQGVLTIGDIIAETALRSMIPVNFYPTKGMAQRGGFVKAQVRLGRQTVGPNIPEKGADLVIAMEVSEALKAVRFVKPGGDFLLFGHVWAPTAVMLGKAPYPTLDQVLEQVQEANGGGRETLPNKMRGRETLPNKMHYLAPESLPLHEGTPVAANVFVLGFAIGHTGLGEVLAPSEVAHIVQTRWTRGAERNLFAFQAGQTAAVGRPCRTAVVPGRANGGGQETLPNSGRETLPNSGRETLPNSGRETLPNGLEGVT